MRKFVLVLCLGLGGCATTQGVPSQKQISDTAKNIQAYTRTLCSFVPTISTIVSIASKGDYQSGRQMAQDLCDAVTTAPLSQGGARKHYVKGVEIKGRFVRGTR